ncbi:MAG: hypothetical protein NTW87_26640 [Planctomycetota bacterium]|nr:hypothetical protein [Planctomycetota bacterium]
MAQQRWILSRGQMLRSMPKHLLAALVSGAVAGMLLYGLKDVQALPVWLLFIIMGTLWANAAVMPVALPGRHWSFAFIGAMMLFLLLVAGTVLAPKFPFSHSHVPAPLPGGGDYTDVAEVNAITWGAVLTGGCLGLLYGLLAGRTPAMAVGLALGAATGYVLGAVSLSAFQWLADPRVVSRMPPMVWRFDGILHFAWQGALAMLVLHVGACVGAILGTGPSPDAPANRKSKIENRK